MQAKNGCWSDENWLIQGWEELEESDTQHSFFEVMLKKKKKKIYSAMIESLWLYL